MKQKIEIKNGGKRQQEIIIMEMIFKILQIKAKI